jgi:uncharacterized protein
MQIVWDEKKRRINIAKHKIDFYQAAEVFSDSLAIIWNDDSHSINEQRLYIIGETSFGNLVVVFYTERVSEIRIISARKPTKLEIKTYEERNRF